jgi:surfeit locus 1 family protein
VRAQTWLLAAAGVGLAVVFALLGQWQLRRAEKAEAVAADFARLAVLPALDILPEADAVGGLRYRRVALRGRYLPQAQVLMDNMTNAGVAGYHVLTPFVTTSGVVAVNRGFVPAPRSRSELPDVVVASEERTVRGRIETLPVPGLRLETEDAGGAAPVRVMSFPDPKDLERAFGRPVAAYQILLDAAEPDGFVRAWQPSADRADRNFAYAGQWFALSLAMLVAALGLLVSSQLRKRSGS